MSHVPGSGLAAYLGDPGEEELRAATEALGGDAHPWHGTGCGLLGVATVPIEVGSLAAVASGDVEVAALLKGYAEHGAAALLAGPGRYAVAVADPEQATVTLAVRGGPPLYYRPAVPHGAVVAASTPAALVAGGARPEVDTAALRRFVDTGELTDLLTEIRRVRSGETVTLTPDGVRPAADPVQAAPEQAAPEQAAARPGGEREPARPGEDSADQGEGSADLSAVAALADGLTHDLWTLLHETGEPPARPADYVRWARSRDPERAPGLAPTRDLVLRLKNRIYGTFLSDQFADRPWADATAEIEGFEAFIAGNGETGDAERFLRLFMAEQWVRVVLDGEPAPVETPEKGPFDPNQDKRIEIEVDGERWARYPIRTELFAKGDDLPAAITGYVDRLASATRDAGQEIFDAAWYLVISEKIVAIAQGRSYFIWEIKPNWWARTLSKYVVRTPYGIGLGSPWTMQLALQEVGLLRILFASAVSLFGKAIGRRGWFYQVAGPAVRAIDGPTEYSAYPANVSAKLAPARPAEVSAELAEALRAGLSAPARDTLAGVVIIDANDIGRNVMGQASDRPDEFFEAVFADNPLGQGNERTPLCVVTHA